MGNNCRCASGGRHTSMSLMLYKVFFTPPPAVKRLGVGKRLGEDTTRQMTQTDQRATSYSLMSCSAIEWRGGEFNEVSTFSFGTG